MIPEMKSDNATIVTRLEEKLHQVAELERVVAPKGVNFAVRGQEDCSSTSAAIAKVTDPLAAADSVIAVLTDSKALIDEAEEIAARAKALSH